MKVTLYSQASRQPDEQIFHQMIEVAAMHPISHYLPYKYFLNGLLTGKFNAYNKLFCLLLSSITFC